MSFDLHPPREVTVFLDNSYGEVFTGTSSKGVDVNGKPSFQPPTAYQKMWEGPVSSGSGQLSLWRPIPPPGYAAVGWIAWRGRTTPQPGNTSVR